MSTFTDWDPYNQYVQGGMTGGRYATAQNMMLAAGPPSLASVGGAAALAQGIDAGAGGPADQIAFPVGLVQNLGLQQSTQLQRIWEIGSSRSYFFSGRTVGQLALGRMYYHGPNLLRTLYAYYQELVPPTLIPDLFDNVGATAMTNPHEVVIPPGFENIFLNLASDLFQQPIGLMMYIRDTNQDTLAALYIENCYVPSHGWQTDAQGLMFQEQVQIQYERIVPVQVTTLQLITDDTDLPVGAVGNGTGPYVQGD